MAVIEDSGATQGCSFKQNPCYGNVVGEIDSRNCRYEQHQQSEVFAIVAKIVILEVLLRVKKDKSAHNDQEHIE